MGRQILNLFPLPDPALVGNPVTQGNYNYQFAGDTEKLRRDNVIRVDWNVRLGHDVLYPRFQMGKEVFGRGQYNETAPALIAGAGMGFPWSKGSYDINTSGYVATLTHMFTPTTVLEVIAGTNWAEQDVYPLAQSDWDALDYRNHLPGHRQYFTENNSNHILPDMTFAALPTRLPNTRAINIGQGQNFPWLATNDTHNFSVNLTHVRGSHNLKVGFFYERTGRPGPAVEQRRHVQLQLRCGQSARHQSRLGERAARDTSTPTPKGTTTPGRCRGSTSRSSSSRTTGA